MKTIMSLIIVIFLSLNCYADLSSVDPVIAKLRKEFSNASMPNIKHLKYRRLWDCTFFSANSGSVHNKDLKISFSQFNGLINMLIHDPENVEKATFAEHSKSGSLLSINYASDEKIKIYLRVTSSGDLIFEVTRPPYDSDESVSESSFASYKYEIAFAYVVCPLMR